MALCWQLGNHGSAKRGRGHCHYCRVNLIPYAEALSGLPRRGVRTILGNSFPGPYRLPMLVAHSCSRHWATPNASGEYRRSSPVVSPLTVCRLCPEHITVSPRRTPSGKRGRSKASSSFRTASKRERPCTAHRLPGNLRSSIGVDFMRVKQMLRRPSV